MNYKSLKVQCSFISNLLIHSLIFLFLINSNNKKKNKYLIDQLFLYLILVNI